MTNQNAMKIKVNVNIRNTAFPKNLHLPQPFDLTLIWGPRLYVIWHRYLFHLKVLSILY